MFGFTPKIEKLFLKIENFLTRLCCVVIPKQQEHQHPTF